MDNKREALAVGTTIRFSSGSIYKITGAPIGSGGGSMIYPAEKLLEKDGELINDGFVYALKECYPVSAGHGFHRADSGEIVPDNDSAEEHCYLEQLRKMQLKEQDITQHIYRTASRMLPIREAADKVLITRPGGAAFRVNNVFTVMESLQAKGQSLTAYIKEYGSLSPEQTFHIIRQLLMALSEIHKAGFLHLDIQAGNIFLRGSLENGSEILTLIDFGSARALNGALTAPITDKAIFTTQGFSAPEILLKNDGTLQLGPEADIYSVGSLILYLLTGSRYDTAALINNNTGKYLTLFKLRKIKCPKHLVDRMQAIIARALENEPENRYRSADEMLAEVEAFSHALQPYRGDLDSAIYDAFISYRHSETDSRAAFELQKRLEHFRAPKGISGKRHPFGRVFVDEGELSSCADYGQQIRAALKNAGWLIVICSPGTAASPWVQSEIDTFLEYHERSRILAVLTAGEPQDAFPPQLLGGKGNAGEVLAADARGSNTDEILKKLRGDALLKLAAPMLGTTFDSLKQRRKVYTLQRVAALSAVLMSGAVAFGLYAAHQTRIISAQAKRIENEYRNALISESRFLSKQAENMLEKEDVISAIELSLQALPSQTQDRPVIPEAERLLGEALGIYKTPSYSAGTASVTGRFAVSDNRRFFSDSDGRYLFTYTYGNGRAKLSVWDSESCTFLRELSGDSVSGIDHFSEDLLIEDTHRLIFGTSFVVSCCDYLSGESLWSVDYDEDKPEGAGFSYYAPQVRALALSESKETLFVLTGASLDIRAADSGELVKRIPLNHYDPFTLKQDEYLSQWLKVSDNLRWAVFETHAASDSFDPLSMQPKSSLHIVDLQSGKEKSLFSRQDFTECAEFIGDRLAVINTLGYSIGIQMTEARSTIYTMDSLVNLALYDAETGDRVWSVEEPFRISSINTCILQTQYTADGVDTQALLFAYGNYCELIELDSGTVLHRYELPESLVALYTLENGFEAYTSDGTTNRTRFDMPVVTHEQWFGGSISSLFKAGNRYFVSSGNDVRKYEMDCYDENYRQIDLPGAYSSLLTTNHCVLNEDEGHLYLCGSNTLIDADLRSGEYRYFKLVGSNDTPNYGILGRTADGKGLLLREYDFSDAAFTRLDSYLYLLLDLESGACKEITPPAKPDYAADIRDSVFIGGRIYYSAVLTRSITVDGKPYLAHNTLGILDWAPGEAQPRVAAEYILNKENTYFTNSNGFVDVHDPRYYVSDSLVQDGDGLLFGVKDAGAGQVYFVHLDLSGGGEKELYPAEFSNENALIFNPSVFLRENGLTVFGFDEYLYLMADDGKFILSRSFDSTPNYAFFSESADRLFVYLRDNLLLAFDTATGEECGTLDLNEYIEYHMYNPRSFRVSRDLALLAGDSEGLLLDLSDGFFGVRAVIPCCTAYDSTEDAFVIADTFSAAVPNVGTFPRYTMAELITMGNQRIGRQ